MNAEILSLILGLTVFFIIISFSQETKTLDSDISLRLENIKNNVFDGQHEHRKIDIEETEESQKIKILIQDTEYKIKAIGKLLDKLKAVNYLKEMLRISGFNVELDVFLTFPLGLLSVFILFAVIVPSKSIPCIAIGLLFSALPFMYLNAKIKKRLALFTQQFPDALGLVASSLRAGHALPSAFKMVVQEMPEPTNQVFKVVTDDITLGRDMREALDSMSRFMPGSIDLRFFITAILIQREVGGNLPEIFDKLSYTIRERFKLIGQLNAQTAQAKLSGYVLALAPVFIGFIIWLINPAYMQPLFGTMMGQLALGVSVTFGVIGFSIIQKITDIRV